MEVHGTSIVHRTATIHKRSGQFKIQLGVPRCIYKGIVDGTKASPGIYNVNVSKSHSLQA